MSEEIIEYKFKLIVKYIIHTYTFLSALEDIEDSKLFQKEVKFHSKQLKKYLEKQLDQPVFNTVMTNDHELFQNIIRSNENLVNLLSEFTLEERFGIEQLLGRIMKGQHKELLTYKIEKLNT